MTAPIIYDDNFSVQLVPSHKHTPDVDSLAGDEVVCAVCGKTLIISCPDGHAGALDRIQYSKGPVPAAPRGEEKNSRRRCKCGNDLEPHKHSCAACKADRERAKRVRHCGCGRVIDQLHARVCDECKAANRDAPPPQAKTGSGHSRNLSSAGLYESSRREEISDLAATHALRGAREVGREPRAEA